MEGRSIGQERVRKVGSRRRVGVRTGKTGNIVRGLQLVQVRVRVRVQVPLVPVVVAVSPDLDLDPEIEEAHFPFADL